MSKVTVFPVKIVMSLHKPCIKYTINVPHNSLVDDLGLIFEEQKYEYE